MGANEKHEAAMHGYVPSTESVREEYRNGRQFGELYSKTDFRAEFDRWLETVRAEAKAEALRDAAGTLNPELINYWRDAMEALSQPIRPIGGDSAMSLQLALVAANRTAVWLRDRAELIREQP